MLLDHREPVFEVRLALVSAWRRPLLGLVPTAMLVSHSITAMLVSHSIILLADGIIRREFP